MLSLLSGLDPSHFSQSTHSTRKCTQQVPGEILLAGADLSPGESQTPARPGGREEQEAQLTGGGGAQDGFVCSKDAFSPWVRRVGVSSLKPLAILSLCQ